MAGGLGAFLNKLGVSTEGSVHRYIIGGRAPRGAVVLDQIQPRVRAHGGIPLFDGDDPPGQR